MKVLLYAALISTIQHHDKTCQPGSTGWMQVNVMFNGPFGVVRYARTDLGYWIYPKTCQRLAESIGLMQVNVMFHSPFGVVHHA